MTTSHVEQIEGQGDLLAFASEQAHARLTDPDTSHAAAASVNVRHSQQQVLALLREGPATDHALADRAYRRGVTISPSGLRSRRSELVDAGLVEDTGLRERLPSGRHAAVWRVIA